MIIFKYMLKRNIVIYASALLIMAIASACQKTVSESDKFDSAAVPERQLPPPVDVDLDEIKERGSLIAVVDNSSTGYFVYKGQPMGYEYELLHRLADNLEVELETRMVTDIHEAFEMLNAGEADIIAYELTVTKERKAMVAFTESFYTTRQVLVQRMPDNWRSLTRDDIERSLIRQQTDLEGKQINVRSNSAYIDRLTNLSDEIGGDILIVEEDDSTETEEIIAKVARGEVEFTVADETLARVNATYYSNIDVATPLSLDQRIAWAVRENAPDLLEAVNEWIAGVKKEPTYNVIYSRYFQNPRGARQHATSEFSSISGEKISPYDQYIREAADKLGWDWRLLAAQMYRESKFDPKAKSWAGAHGLMQLVPETGRRFGARDLYNPEQNISAASNFIKHLDNLWAKTVLDDAERVKFVLASYNVGLGHVEDARNLAVKYGYRPDVWDGNVERFLLLKSKRKYFTDSVVRSGYCRGHEPVEYVKTILEYYDMYKQLIDS